MKNFQINNLLMKIFHDKTVQIIFSQIENSLSKTVKKFLIIFFEMNFFLEFNGIFFVGLFDDEPFRFSVLELIDQKENQNYLKKLKKNQ